MSFLLLALFLAAPPQQEKKKDSVLRVAWTSPSTLDPALGRTREDARVLSALFEGLVTFGPDHMTPVPGMAERWEKSEDGLSWTFHLGDAKWSGGEPVTAHDFIFAWRRLLDPKTDAPFGNLLRMFRNVSAFLDAREARWLLSDLESALFAGENLGDRTADLEFLLEAAGRDLVPRLKKLSERTKGEVRALFEKTLDSASKRPRVGEADLGFSAKDGKTLSLVLEKPAPWLLDTLGFMALYPVPRVLVEKEGSEWPVLGLIQTNGPYRIRSGSEDSLELERVRGEGPETVVVSWTSSEKALASFKRGELDWLDEAHIPARSLEEVAKGEEFHFFNQWGTWFLQLNTEKAPFQKKAARLAFAHSVDRDAISALVKLAPANSLVPPGFPEYPRVRAPEYNRSSAVKALLRGWLDTSKFPRCTLLVPDDLRGVGVLLRKQWKESLGIEVRLKAMKYPAYLRALSTGEYDVALTARVGEVFHPSAFVGEGPDAEKNLIADEVRVIPLYSMGTYRLVSGKVKGAVPNLLGRVLLQHIRK